MKANYVRILRQQGPGATDIVVSPSRKLLSLLHLPSWHQPEPYILCWILFIESCMCILICSYHIICHDNSLSVLTCTQSLLYSALWFEPSCWPYSEHYSACELCLQLPQTLLEIISFYILCEVTLGSSCLCLERQQDQTNNTNMMIILGELSSIK